MNSFFIKSNLKVNNILIPWEIILNWFYTDFCQTKIILKYPKSDAYLIWKLKIIIYIFNNIILYFGGIYFFIHKLFFK